ncbi:MAG TPA: hypothetical protein VHX39_19430 [Acetobacteraceae bacterium]|jgi:hypothetical protein|nr:hypothetical protein [Acetobacteraceae bacterium]
MRRAVRRRQDNLRAAKGIALGFVIGAGLWALLWFGVRALAVWLIFR